MPIIILILPLPAAPENALRLRGHERRVPGFAVKTRRNEGCLELARRQPSADATSRRDIDFKS